MHQVPLSAVVEQPIPGANSNARRTCKASVRGAGGTADVEPIGDWCGWRRCRRVQRAGVGNRAGDVGAQRAVSCD